MGNYARPDSQFRAEMGAVCQCCMKRAINRARLTIELRSEGSSFVALEASRSSSLRRFRLVLTCNEFASLETLF